MRDGYRHWFEDVTSSIDHDSPRIVLGTPHENPAVLTRQDWRGPRAGWGADSLGHWDVEIADAGDYEITVHLLPDGPRPDGGTKPTKPTPTDAVAGTEQPAAGGEEAAPRVVRFRMGDVQAERRLEPGQKSLKFPAIKLPAGPAQLEVWVRQGEETVGVRFVELLNLGEPTS
jgi:hypothetical protein